MKNTRLFTAIPVQPDANNLLMPSLNLNKNGANLANMTMSFARIELERYTGSITCASSNTVIATTNARNTF